MNTLIGWDDPAEAATIDALLNVCDAEVKVVTDADEFCRHAESKSWDVIVLALDFPDTDSAIDIFNRAHSAHPESPIIGCWRQGEVAHLARFITAGLHSHLMRDDRGDFIFLLTSMSEAALLAVEAQRAKILADRLRQEVDSVRRLQESVIPLDLPVPEGYKIAARYEQSQIRVVGSQPMTMAGGDYYDVFRPDEGTLVLLVGDASGHGVKACMSIMTMHTLIRMFQNRRYENTATFVREVNQRLCANDVVKGDGGFITLLYGALDLSNHRLQWTSAGAPMPLIQRLDTNEIAVVGDDDAGGLPLAIDEDWEYEALSVEIPTNSRLLIYTDGLDEAFPEGNEDADNQFGLQGIKDSLQASAHLPVEQALAKLFDDSNAHTQGTGRMDDTSIVLLERASS